MFVWTRLVMVSWQHRSIENVWQTATTVSIYKHSVRITEYPSKLIHIGYAEKFAGLRLISAFEYQVSH